MFEVGGSWRVDEDDGCGLEGGPSHTPPALQTLESHFTANYRSQPTQIARSILNLCIIIQNKYYSTSNTGMKKAIRNKVWGSYLEQSSVFD